MSDPARRASIRPLATLVAALVLLLPLAYWRSLGNGYIWDDDYYVYANPLLLDLDGLRTIWLGIFDGPSRYVLPQYYPVTHTSFWLEHQLWGDAALGYRLTNLALHGAASVLIFAILRRLQVRGAWLAAMLFAVHPLHVESVAWVTERKNVLSAALGLGAFLAWLRWLESSARRDYLVGVGLFVLALGAKSVVATLPAAFVVVAWWSGDRLRRAIVAMLVPFAIGAAYGMLTAYMEVHRVGASGPEWDFSPTTLGEIGARVQLAGRAVWFYLGKLFVPWPLMFSYPRVPPDASDALGYLAPLTAATAVIGLWLARSKIGRGPAAGAFLFCGLLTPALGFSNVLPMRYSFVADHFCYLASVPVLAGVAWTIDRVTGQCIGAERSTAAAYGRASASSLLVGACVALTFRHAGAFHDARSLWLDTIAKNPSSWLAQNNLALLEMEAGDVAAARARFEAILRDVKPDHREAQLNLAELDRRAGDAASARRRLDALVARHPDYGAAWRARGSARERDGDEAGALADYARAAGSPDAGATPRALYARALVRRSAGESDAARRATLAEAESVVAEANRLAPRDADAWLVRAQVAIARDDGATARRAIESAARAAPGRADVLVAQAGLRLAAGDVATAERMLRAAAAQRPDAFEPAFNLAALLERSGRPDEAAGWRARAAAIRPDDPRLRDRP